MIIGRLIFILSLSSLAGCVFPVIVKKQPSLEFIVLDELNNPVEGAEINFVRYSLRPMPAIAEAWHSILKTDKTGRAVIEKESELQAYILAADGGYREYDWAWCVAYNNYLPVYKVGISETLDSNTVNVVLKDRGTEGGCEWNPKYMSGEFVSNAP
jgi:hypothetical protein